MSPRLKRILFGIALLLVGLAYWIDHRQKFPSVIRNQATVAALN
jgi:hypothetical protein